MNVEATAAEESSSGGSSTHSPLPPGETDTESGLPWSVCCVPGCGAKTDAGEGKIILLNCLHAICLDKCSAEKFREVARKNPRDPSLIICPGCQWEVTEEQLTTQVSIKAEFLTKVCPTLLCQLCRKKPPAIAYCPECTRLLCDYCVKNTHGDNVDFESHLDKVTTDLTELVREAEKNANNCASHFSAESTHYCFRCKKKLCELCKMEHESGHPVDIANLRMDRNELGSQLEMARVVMKDSGRVFTEATRKIDEQNRAFARFVRILPLQHCLNSAELKKLTEVDKTLEGSFKALNDSTEALKQQVKSAVKKRVKELEFKKDIVESVGSVAKQFIKAGEWMLSDDMDVAGVSNFLRLSRTLQANLLQKHGLNINKDFLGPDMHLLQKSNERRDEETGGSGTSASFGQPEELHITQGNSNVTAAETNKSGKDMMGIDVSRGTVDQVQSPSQLAIIVKMKTVEEEEGRDADNQLQVSSAMDPPKYAVSAVIPPAIPGTSKQAQFEMAQRESKRPRIADDLTCNPRNPIPATVFNNAVQNIDVYGNDVEVDDIEGTKSPSKTL